MEAIVGFFDILGYTSFLESNQTEDVTESVLRIINTIPKIVQAESSLALSAGEDIMAQMHFLVFSDTILMTLDTTGNSRRRKYEQWKRFILHSVLLSKNLLINGLPVRGAITNGSIVIQNYCFAGAPIVEAYRLCNSLELAATVIAHSSFAAANELDHEFGVSFTRFFVEDYPPPMKHEVNRMPILLWPTLSTSPFSGTAKEIARRAFEAWGKRLTGSAPQKLANTITFFETFRDVFFGSLN